MRSRLFARTRGVSFAPEVEGGGTRKGGRGEARPETKEDLGKDNSTQVLTRCHPFDYGPLVDLADEWEELGEELGELEQDDGRRVLKVGEEVVVGELYRAGSHIRCSDEVVGQDEVVL